jgi:hypothetical protein
MPKKSFSWAFSFWNRFINLIKANFQIGYPLIFYINLHRILIGLQTDIHTSNLMRKCTYRDKINATFGYIFECFFGDSP